MDGIAVHFAAFKDGAPDTTTWERGVDWQFCNTGIGMPDGFDTAIPIEWVHVSEDNQHVTLDQLPLFCIFALIGLFVAASLIKPLNALLLGTLYAENLGINIRRTRALLLLSTGLLVAVTTAYCGPISFIGLAVPHMARLLLGTSDHKRLMPATMLCGAAVALLCNLISTLPAGGRLLPLNAITPIIGAPVIIFVILKDKR